MGMTNGQFKSYIRLLLDDIKDIEEEDDIVEVRKKLGNIKDILQDSLES